MKNNIKLIGIGADPEVFVYDLVNNKVVPITGIIGGTKDEPLPIPGLKNGFFMQEDNVMLEYNIPPAATANELYENNQLAIRTLNDLLSKQNLEIFIKSAHYFDWSDLKDPSLQEFGCSPEMNPYLFQNYESPKGAETNLRCCGGHVHIGLSENDPYKMAELSIVLDGFVGLMALILDSSERSELYGKPGACRFKDYGIEYRVPSNYWIGNKHYTNLLFQQIEKAIKYYNEFGEFSLSVSDKIRNAISNNNVSLAATLLEQHKFLDIKKLEINESVINEA